MSDRKIKIVYKETDSRITAQIDYKNENCIRVALSSIGCAPAVFSTTCSELLLFNQALKDLFDELGA